MNLAILSSLTILSVVPYASAGIGGCFNIKFKAVGSTEITAKCPAKDPKTLQVTTVPSEIDLVKCLEYSNKMLQHRYPEGGYANHCQDCKLDPKDKGELSCSCENDITGAAEGKAFFPLGRAVKVHPNGQMHCEYRHKK